MAPQVTGGPCPLVEAPYWAWSMSLAPRTTTEIKIYPAAEDQVPEESVQISSNSFTALLGLW